MSKIQRARALLAVEALGPCTEASGWLAANHGKTPLQLWRSCERADWMLWLLGRLDIDRRYLVAAAIGCARLSQHLDPSGEARRTLDVVSRWTQGGATLCEVRVARAAAADAAAAYSYAAAAADAAAAYSYAADAAAYAADAAAAAYSYAADAAAYAAAARLRCLKQGAAIVRKVVPWSMVRDALARAR